MEGRLTDPTRSYIEPLFTTAFRPGATRPPSACARSPPSTRTCRWCSAATRWRCPYGVQPPFYTDKREAKRDVVMVHWADARAFEPDPRIDCELMMTRDFDYPYSLPNQLGAKAAEMQGGQRAHWDFFDRVQRAHLTEARNIADYEVLRECAEEIGLDGERWQHDVFGEHARSLLADDIERAARYGILASRRWWPTAATCWAASRAPRSATACARRASKRSRGRRAPVHAGVSAPAGGVRDSGLRRRGARCPADAGTFGVVPFCRCCTWLSRHTISSLSRYCATWCNTPMAYLPGKRMRPPQTHFDSPGKIGSNRCQAARSSCTKTALDGRTTG